MTLSKEDLQRLARLASLDPEDGALAGCADRLSRIIDMTGRLDEVDTGDAEPMIHSFEMVQRLRADEVTESGHRELYQRNAPAARDGLYLVPRVIE